MIATGAHVAFLIVVIGVSPAAAFEGFSSMVAQCATVRIVCEDGSVGSGVICYERSDRGFYILTNEHVTDGRPWKIYYVPFTASAAIEQRHIKVVAEDRRRDLALVYVSSSSGVDPPLVINIAKKSAPTRNRVLAAGFKDGDYFRVYQGNTTRVSGTDFVMDLRLYSGMSGGPVFNSDLKVIAINRAINRFTGNSYAVHDDAIRAFLRDADRSFIYTAGSRSPRRDRVPDRYAYQESERQRARRELDEAYRDVMRHEAQTDGEAVAQGIATVLYAIVVALDESAD